MATGFDDASIRAGLGVNRKYVGFGVDFFDFDNDGWQDIFIANGHVYSQLADAKTAHVLSAAEAFSTAICGNGRFEDVSAQAGPAIGAENLGRGCAFGDFDNDGDVDILVNNLDGPPTLLRNDGGNREQLDLDQVRRHALESLSHRRPRQGHRAAAATRWTR